MKYTMHRVIRNKELENGILELVLERNKLNWGPGDQLSIVGSAGQEPLLIASEPGCPWLRVLYRRNAYPDLAEINGLSRRSLKISGVSTYVDIMGFDSCPGCLVQGIGIAPVFAYKSMYPERKVNVCIQGSPVNADWCNANLELFPGVGVMPDDTIVAIGPAGDIDIPEGQDPLTPPVFIDATY